MIENKSLMLHFICFCEELGVPLSLDSDTGEAVNKIAINKFE